MKSSEQVKQTKLLGLALAKVRQEKGLTQRAASNSCNMFHTYLSGLESGSKNITFLMMLKICKGYKILPSELFKVYEELAEENNNHVYR